ncbi:hypothetical protein [Oceanicoccus sagamiensis]|uniref:Uncharacterized protein n=1 Tax=Oceanicoccus sagamiensis TaxID=716816 RepID=A0A1X9N986_9GAMM|nr:hypothetical protein [Oceanicoccus sagamiensis]ARN73644.1 hypothetical protein BST96_05630 [Oceanicoccus sagamiensis]
MTTWNYRVIRKNCANTREVTYQIHEVYYLADGSIDCWNHTPVEPLGVSEPGLRNDIQSFLGAFRQPVLEERYINGKARLVAERMNEPGKDLQADYVSKTTRASGYINQILGNHLLLKQEPSLRQAYDKVDQALAELHDIVNSKHYRSETV